MLSNQNNSPDHRRRRQPRHQSTTQQHRRQHSIQTTTDTSKVPILNTNPIQQQTAHRRGQSLDQRAAARQLRRTPQAEQHAVSTLIQGYEQQHHQHVLREAQQQRLARPGQQRQGLRSQGTQIEQNLRRLSAQDCKSLTNSDEYTRLVTEQRNGGTIRPSRISGNRSEGNSPEADIFSVFNPNFVGVNPQNDGLIFDENGKILIDRREGPNLTASNVPRGRGRHDATGRKTQSLIIEPNVRQIRPQTPPNHGQQNFFPITPATTPHNRVARTEPHHRASVDFSAFDGDETIKPARAPKASLKDMFGELEYAPQGEAFPSPPNSAVSFDQMNFGSAAMQNSNFMNMSSLALDFSGSECGYDSSYYSPLSSALSPSMSSFQSSPEMANQTLFDHSMDDDAGSVDIMMGSSDQMGDYGHGQSQPMTREPTSDSVTKIDATIEDTGITIEDIAIYIAGPDDDGKWVCLFPECGKRFGRKENIKSHVQTHLGDRQYRCNHCKKCFVRQHDLKRHSKIHSGLKPYPCKCGHSFARHDALTRHRQRGMCVGAFENVQRKVVKRGRPRKHRPDDEERTTKSTRTRTKNKAKNYASSVSGASQTSNAPSPGQSLDSASSRETSPYQHESPQPSQSLPVTDGAPFQFTPPVSPKVEIDPFLCTQQTGSFTDLASIENANVTTEKHTENNDKRGSVQYNTPPDLCLSSSSPPPSNFFDLESTSGINLDLNQTGDDFFSGTAASQFDLATDANNGVPKFDSFGLDDDFSALEKDPNALWTKFDDQYWSNTNMVQDDLGNEDIFFNSP